MTTKPKAPESLSKASQALWLSILKDWSINDAGHLQVLLEGLHALDRAERCRQQINAEGETTLDRFGQSKPHPLLSAERDSRSQFLTAFKALGLDPTE